MRLRPFCASAALLAASALAAAPAAAAPSAFISAGNGYCRDVALTYDTEFGEITPTLAATLEELDVRATFFFVGDDMAANAGLVRRLAARHQVANHTYSHEFMADLTPNQMREQFTLAEEAIVAASGRNPRPFWRPPYGNWDEVVLDVAGEMGYSYTVYWSMDTRDWQGPPAQVIRERLVSQAFPGGIALMHGSPLATPEGTRLAVSDLRAMGYQFVTVSEIVGVGRHLRDFGGDRYVVQSGDAPGWVAGCHNLTAPRLLAYNEVDTLDAGQTLAIPHTAEVIIRLEGERLSFPIYPRVTGGRTVAHVRLAERLGATVDWDGARVIITADGTELIITPGEQVALVDGEPHDMGAAAVMEQDRVLVPVRFLAEQLGAAVSWDGTTWTVSIE
ncbi:MAG TPA: polysaccharide deacetylase family protein [Symbiobacteriaceae bacterium]|nr:polysaccharide deacetylase family protein [Symbiobacteriaceae bacterium]